MTNLRDYLNDLIETVLSTSSDMLAGELTQEEAKDGYDEAIEDCMDGVKKLMGIV